MHEYTIDYQMQRRYPEFHRMDGPFFVRLGVLAFLFALPLTISIFFADNTAFLHWFGSVIFLLVDLVLFIVFLFAFSRTVSWLRQKRMWIKTSASAQTTIVERKRKGDVEQSGYRAGGWSLGLAVIPPQSTVTPKESLVWVDITEAQYEKYARGSTVRIQYAVKDPFVFLLEDEV